jgi:hypothetical protein
VDKILVRVVDDIVGTECLQASGLFRRSGRGNHRGAGELGELDAAHPDTAGGAEDQYFFARRHPAMGEHHPPCRAIDTRKCRGLGKTDAIGDLDELMRAQAAIFGEPAMHCLAG